MVLVVVAAVAVVGAFAVAAAVVAPSFPGVSPLAPGVTPVVYLLFPDASPGVPAASERAYPPWCLPSVALSASGLQLRDQLRLVEDVEDPSQVVVVVV